MTPPTSSSLSPALALTIAPVAVNVDSRPVSALVRGIIGSDDEGSKCTYYEWKALHEPPFTTCAQNINAPWIILVDAHGEPKDFANLFTTILPKIAPHLPANWRATLVFVDTDDHASLMPTREADLFSGRRPRELSSRFRLNDFFHRMVVSYQWGYVAHVSRLPQLILRLQNRTCELFRFTASEILNWTCDVARLWEAARFESLQGPFRHAAVGPDLVETVLTGQPEKHLGTGMFRGLSKDTFIRDLALFHQMGRRNEDEAEMSLRSVDWMNHHPGEFKIREARSKLLRKSAHLAKERIELTEAFRLVSKCHNDGKEELTEVMRILRERPGTIERLNAVLGTNQNPESILRALSTDVEAAISARREIDLQLRRTEQRLINYAERRNRLNAKLEMYRVMRDLARCMTHGTAAWAARSRFGNQPIRVLAIKDYVRDGFERERLHTAFKTAFEAAFRQGDVELDCFEAKSSSSAAAKDDRWDLYEWWRSRVNEERDVEVTRHVVGSQAKVVPDRTAATHLLDYDFILIEANYKTRFVGPRVVQWLDMALDEFDKAENHVTTNRKGRSRPQILALSRTENAGQIYICLSHGAEAFASKSRVYAIPALLTLANVGRRTVPPEPRNSRPNFRALYGLLPHAANRLRSDEAEDMINGDEWDRAWLKQLPKADLHFHLGTSITIDCINSLACNTAGYALDSSSSGEIAPPDSTILRPLLESVCKIVLLSNLTSNASPRKSHRPMSFPEHLWACSRFILTPRDKRGKVVPPDLPEKHPFDEVIHWLTRTDRPVQAFESCSLLVAALFVFERVLSYAKEGKHTMNFVDEGHRERMKDELLGCWRYLGGLGVLFSADPAVGHSKSRAHTYLGAVAGQMDGTVDYLLRRIQHHWKHAYTKERIMANQPENALACDWFGALYRQVKRNIERTVDQVSKVFQNLLNDIEWLGHEEEEFVQAKGDYVFSPEDLAALKAVFASTRKTAFPPNMKEFVPTTLSRLVVVADEAESATPQKQRSLARYLWGAGLLGAEHLQFPENILLACADIVGQNVCDNVVYSEVRCATNGYCHAGMNPQDATDLLCLGFDLAATLFGCTTASQRRKLFEVTEPFNESLSGRIVPSTIKFVIFPPKRWVRTNVLLGAKRHKSLDELNGIVNLVRSYLERGREVGVRSEVESFGTETPGSWWDRCHVVGFDLSGDEQRENLDLRSAIEPLFVVSAPITIHAGEAATAQSIWDAVYRLGAERIGHGIRLREDQKLLEICVRRGICMELCPISNMFTNVFEPIELSNRHVMKDDRAVYPLRSFLDSGLDVCLNTDNRTMHQRGTLTDEFMAAAHLVGGLTRWDVLKIAKAGFKSAFMPKSEVAALLRHVEYEVYHMTVDYPDEQSFPAPGRIGRRKRSS